MENRGRRALSDGFVGRLFKLYMERNFREELLFSARLALVFVNGGI